MHRVQERYRRLCVILNFYATAELNPMENVRIGYFVSMHQNKEL